MTGRKEQEVSINHTATDRTGALLVAAEIYTPQFRIRGDFRVPPPAVPRTSGIEVPFSRGEIRYPDGTRAHIITWDHIILGGPPLVRKLMRAFSITPVRTNGQNGNGRR